MLPSKLTNILASRRPVIVTAATGTGLATEAEGCGIIVPPDDPPALAAAIEALLDDEGARHRFGEAARRRALEHWQQDAILERLETQLVALAKAKGRA